MSPESGVMGDGVVALGGMASLGKFYVLTYLLSRIAFQLEKVRVCCRVSPITSTG
jgi:hypothetical protein